MLEKCGIMDMLEGGLMESVEQIKSILETKGTVKFKLYSLDYIIEKTEDNKYSIYPELYNDKHKKTFSSVDELLDSYTVYNENISSNIERISNIE